MQENHLLLKKLKNTDSAQLWTQRALYRPQKISRLEKYLDPAYPKYPALLLYIIPAHMQLLVGNLSQNLSKMMHHFYILFIDPLSVSSSSQRRDVTLGGCGGMLPSILAMILTYILSFLLH